MPVEYKYKSGKFDKVTELYTKKEIRTLLKQVSSNLSVSWDSLSFVPTGFGVNIYSRNEVADFGTADNLEAGSLTDEFWSTYISSSTNGANDREIKIKIKYYHRKGIDKLTANFFARTDNSGDSTFDNDIWFALYDSDGGTKVLEQNEEILSGSANEHTLTMDISSLTDGNFYIIQVETEAQIGTVNSGTPTAGTELREDITIVGTA